MSNNFFNPYQQDPMGAYQYAPTNNVEWTQPLTQEERRSLRSTAPAFDVLNVSKEEMTKAHCAHRDPMKKEFTLVETADGTFKCDQCGEEFNLVDISEEEVEQYVNGIIDVLQTTKMLYVDLPPATIDAYFQMIPFLKKLPKLYKLAHDTFQRATGSSSIRGAYASRNPWMTMGQAVNGVYNGMPNQGMPYGGYDPNYGYGGYAQPNPYQGQAPAGNPFMQNGPAQNQVPFNPTYTQQNGGGYQQPSQNAAPAAQNNNNQSNGNNQTVSTNKQFEV